MILTLKLTLHENSYMHENSCSKMNEQLHASSHVDSQEEEDTMNIIENPFLKFKLQHNVINAELRDLNAAWREMSLQCKKFMFISTINQFMRGMCRNYKKNIMLGTWSNKSPQKEFLTIANDKIKGYKKKKKKKNKHNNKCFTNLPKDILCHLSDFLTENERLKKLSMLNTYCFAIGFGQCGNAIHINRKKVKAIVKDKQGIFNYNYSKSSSIEMNQLLITNKTSNAIENIIKSVANYPKNSKLSIMDFDKWNLHNIYIRDWSSTSINIVYLFLKLKKTEKISFNNISKFNWRCSMISKEFGASKLFDLFPNLDYFKFIDNIDDSDTSQALIKDILNTLILRNSISINSINENEMNRCNRLKHLCIDLSKQLRWDSDSPHYVKHLKQILRLKQLSSLEIIFAFPTAENGRIQKMEITEYFGKIKTLIQEWKQQKQETNNNKNNNNKNDKNNDKKKKNNNDGIDSDFDDKKEDNKFENNVLDDTLDITELRLCFDRVINESFGAVKTIVGCIVDCIARNSLNSMNLKINYKRGSSRIAHYLSRDVTCDDYYFLVDSLLRKIFIKNSKSMKNLLLNLPCTINFLQYNKQLISKMVKVEQIASVINIEAPMNYIEQLMENVDMFGNYNAIRDLS